MNANVHCLGLHRLRPCAQAVFLLMTMACATAQTLPSGGVVVRGAGTIQVNGNAMVVNQTAPRLVTDWTSFSIGAGSSVRFVQPSADAVALNRVVGNNASTIFGSLSSNGHVYLQNPNGVLFAPGAQIDVGSLVATSLNADLTQFMASQLRLSGGSPASGDVVNEGRITVAPGGHVVLAGPRVTNRGSIEAPGGTIGLAAGNAVTVDATGAGLLDIRVPVAAIDARLEHSGRLVADGGLVSLQAAAADAARRTVMQVDGVVRAQRIENRGGQIVLSGGDSGIVQVSAALDASAPGGQGGEIRVLGERVALVGQARLDASGAQGGGNVLVGGNLRGKGVELNAKATYVGRDVTLDASATNEGDGGRVVVWSDGRTTYAGQSFAIGGAMRGDGGLVEVSGKQMLDFQGGADLRAAHGRQGTLLLDPLSIDIGTVANVNGDSTAGDDLATNTLLASDFANSASFITADRVATLLSTADVDLHASRDITVSAPLTVPAGGALSTLTLEAPVVFVSAPMTLNNSALDIISSSDVSVGADVQTNRSVTIRSHDIALNSGTVTADALTLSVFADGQDVVIQDPAHAIVANQVIAGVPGASFVGLQLEGNSNQIHALSLNAESASVINANNGYLLDLSGTAGFLDVITASGITQSAPLVAGGLALTTTDPNPVTGAVLLTNPANQIGGLHFAVASHLSVNTSGDLTVGDICNCSTPVTAGGDIHLGVGGLFTLGGDVGSTGALGAPLIDIRSAGFNNSGQGLLLAPGGRFVVQSTDFTQDNFGPIGFGSGANDVNYIVFNGYTGASPTSGNGLVTNQEGLLVTNPADLGAVSKAYDGSAAINVSSSGINASAFAVSGSGNVALSPVASYTANLSGSFDDNRVGTNKGFSLLASNDTAAGSTAGVTYYGLQTAAFTRPAGPSAITPISEIAASPLSDFEDLRFNQYLQGVSDAQEPFRRAMAEALAAGFGKENIRKRLALGLVFETGLAPPAIEEIGSAKSPVTCAPGSKSGAPLSCP